MVGGCWGIGWGEALVVVGGGGWVCWWGREKIGFGVGGVGRVGVRWG